VVACLLDYNAVFAYSFTDGAHVLPIERTFDLRAREAVLSAQTQRGIRES
jgi:hypothetical protein